MSHTDKTDPLAEAKLRFPWGVEGEYDEEKVWVFLKDHDFEYQFIKEDGEWDAHTSKHVTLTAPLPEPQRLHTMEEMERLWKTMLFTSRTKGLVGDKTFNGIYNNLFPTPVTHRAMDADERLRWYGKLLQEVDKPSEVLFTVDKDDSMQDEIFTGSSTHYRPTPDSEWLELPKVEV